MNANIICHGHVFDEMDICEPSYSYEDFLEPVKCSLNEQQDPTPDARSISIESDATPVNRSIHVPQNYTITGGYSDIFAEYDIFPTILGTGHYGCVRECLHRSSGQRFAVKTIDKSKVGRLDHIQREINLLRKINHSGVMKMVACYEDADYVHIVTEKYTGGELFDKIVDNTTDTGCLSEAQAVKIIKSLLESVQYLHANDIVHRDIKPENVLFESNEEGAAVKLIDFGLSRTHCLYGEGYMTNQVGTPYYMSPGVLAGQYDKNCDIWAIGIVAYILLAGYPPFNGDSDWEVQESIKRGGLVFERQVWENLSKTSRDFVKMLLDQSQSCTAEDALRHPWIARA
jgi:serine/threonine protein kinase